jgi:BirA family biotin operon repressor/biotin-[acetyl-CoA-carboxylase] ligase
MATKGESILFSLLIKDRKIIENYAKLSLLSGNIVFRLLSKYTDKLSIKWPNDVYVDGKKVCGILTEMSLAGSEIDYVIVGTGVNVNQYSFDEEIQKTATSIALEVGRVVDRKELQDAVLETFAINYEKFLQTKDMQLLLDAYNAVLINKGKEIRVLDPAGEYSGVSGGINEKGELLVTRDDGSCEAVYAGEVSVRGVYGYV